MSVLETPDFEVELMKRAYKSGDPVLRKLCINMVNRNKVLEYNNARLMLKIAPPEWGDAAIYKQRLQMLGKIARKMAREYMRLSNALASDRKYAGHCKQAEERASMLNDFFLSNKMPEIYPK